MVTLNSRRRDFSSAYQGAIFLPHRSGDCHTCGDKLLPTKIVVVYLLRANIFWEKIFMPFVKGRPNQYRLEPIARPDGGSKAAVTAFVRSALPPSSSQAPCEFRRRCNKCKRTHTKPASLSGLSLYFAGPHSLAIVAIGTPFHNQSWQRKISLLRCLFSNFRYRVGNFSLPLLGAIIGQISRSHPIAARDG